MPWPAWYLQEKEYGTCYLRPSDFPAVLKRWDGAGQGWRFRNQWTTYRPNGKVAYKNIQRLGPASWEDFRLIMQGCEQAGMEPPTSYVDPFLHVYFPRLVPRSVTAPFYRTFGGWQEAFWKGTWWGKVWHYDMRKAYRWAGCQGLPDLRTAVKTDNWKEPNAIYLCELWGQSKPYDQWYGQHVVTSEERDQLKITPKRVLFGLRFERMVDLRPVFGTIDQLFPQCRDRISQSYWGMWNAKFGPEQVTWRSGHRVRTLRNPMFNPIWSAFITSRVKLRIIPFLPIVLHCFVDSMLTKEVIVTGDRIGDWVLKDHFRSVWIRGPGIWGTRDRTIKHCGLTRSE